MQVFYTGGATKFLKSLESPELARVLRVVDLLEKYGHELGLPHSRHLGGGLLELRVLGIPSFRLCYLFKDGKAIVLHGFMKKSNNTPKQELLLVRRIARELD
jgi:phage-related protein